MCPACAVPLPFARPHSVDRPEKRKLAQSIATERRAVLLVNSRSRRGKLFYAEAKRLLEARGIALDPAFSGLDVLGRPDVIPDALAAGHRFIIVGGGDGTFSPILRHFAHRDIVLGILPLGTANSFARTLGIPIELEGAIDVLCSGKVVDVDLGRIDDHYFASVASVGLAARITRHMPHELKRRFGRLAYPLVALAQMRRFGAFRCTVIANGSRTNFEALEVRVANGRHQAGILVAQEASAESRDLVLHVTTGHSLWKLVKVWLRLSAGARPEPRDMQTMRAAEFSIEAEPPQYASIDGEAFICTPFTASVARQALLVMVPQDTPGLE